LLEKFTIKGRDMHSITRDDIDVLVKLQGVETEANRIKAVLNEVPKKLDVLDTKLREFEQLVEDQEAIVSELKIKYRENESDVQMHLDMISKSQEKLVSVKTNKEYQAILKEIGEFKKKNCDIEDEMLASLDRTEADEKVLSDRKTEYSQLKDEIESEKDLVIKESEAEEKKLSLFETDWNKIAEQIAPELLEIYKKVQKQTKGITITTVKNAVCQACYMNIPPQMYNELHRCDELNFCPHCYRIVYYNGAGG
jgi:predicted  nucleic acid-binding Zn-ribbon protein